MKIGFIKFVGVTLVGLLCSLNAASGIRITVDREECLSHDVNYRGDTIHVSFVVIKVESTFQASSIGIDLVVKGPSGVIDSYKDRISEKFEFVALEQGAHHFCFTNKSPYMLTIDFDLHESHFSSYGQHAKDEHFDPLLEQISKLEEALYSIQFEQHWLEAQTERQAIVNEKLGQKAVHKALYESAALIAVSVLQVFLLRRLFGRKLGAARV